MADIRPFCMPKWGIEMTEGVLAEWQVSQGDAFKRGQTLCLIETAKITNEVEAEYDAVVRRVLVPAGGEAQPVGALLAVFAEAGASEEEIDQFVAGFRPADTAVAAKAGAPAPTPAPAPKPAEPAKIVTNRPISPEALKLAEREGADLSAIEGSGRGGRITYQDVQQALRPQARPALRGTALLPDEAPRGSAVFASPLARRLAALHGVDLAGVKGTGARGRISKADVLALLPDGGANAAFIPAVNTPQIVPFDGVRKVVARRLTEAKQQIPHFYLRVSAAADALIALRKTANLVLGAKASINDYLVKAAALALVRHPEVNVQVHGETIHRFPHADVAIAVASPKGLVTPIVRQADRLGIAQLSAETRRLIDKAAAGRLSLEDMDGGTFSVSNLGMMGVEEFDAIINPPQAAILAVGAVTRQPVELPGGDFAFESRIALTLSVDHRAIDGAAGAQFLATLKYWTEVVGVGPFFLLENVQLGEMKYRGTPSDAVFSIAIGYWNDIQIELIRAENDAPSIYSGEYAVKDQMHHVCIFVKSIAEARAACAAVGAEILVEGKVGDTGEVIYVDAGGGPGHVIELLQPMEGSEGLFQMMKDAARDWDGSDPLRVVG